jgi:NADP-dependent 3-hydroxy acid dehydrogenase YdfG
MTRKIALVTGVGPGTGSAIVRRLVAGGYEVAMLTRSEARLRQLEIELTLSARSSPSVFPQKVFGLKQPLAFF